jgi:ligand-binding sensor domain-containing protein
MHTKALLIYFIFFSSLVFGQKPFYLSFSHLTREKGLSNTNIISMLQDSRGYIWMGTMNGLNRFDGSNIKVYKPYNSNIKGNYINNILEDKTGLLWIGTNEGLICYDRSKDSFTQMPGPQYKQTYTAIPIFIDQKGLVWVSTSKDDKLSLHTFDPENKRFELIFDNAPKQFADLNQPNYTELKNLYASVGTGFKKFTFLKNKHVKTEIFLDGKISKPALENLNSHIFIESDSIIWLTNSQYGLSKFNPNTKKFTSYLYFDNQKLFTLNKIVPYGSYLFICGNNGIHVFDKNTQTFVQNIRNEVINNLSLAGNYVENLYIDRQNNLFCSVFGNGIDYANLKQFKAKNIFPIETSNKLGIIDNAVYRILPKGENILIKLQHGGTVEIDKNGKVIAEIKNSGQPIFVDNKKRYWTTQNSAQNKLKIFNEQLKLTKSIDPKPLFNWFSFYGQGQDLGAGKFVISNVTDVFEFDENKNSWLSITAGTNMGKPINTFYFEEKDKLLFVSSNWWNVFNVFEKKGTNWKLKQKLNFDFNVFCISKAQKPGYLWLGTDKGLVSFNYKTLKYKLITEKEGLPDDAINDIIEEKNGDYWLVSNKGICFYSNTRKTFREYGVIDGVNSKHYNGNMNFKMADSSFIFGGTNGVTRINIENKNSLKNKPNIQINEISINEKSIVLPLHISEAKEIFLQPDQNSFAIDLVAIDFLEPEKLKLKYRLNGIDKEWILAPNPSTARYAELNEGDYVLEIMAGTSNDEMQTSVKKLIIHIKAPFYRTSWFRAFLAVILVSLAYVFYNIRSNQIRKEAQKKEQIRRIKAEAEINALRSQMNPHFIFNCLNTVDSYILLNKTNEASDFLNKFSKLVRMILENSRQDFIPLQQDIKALELYINLERERSNASFDYQIDIEPECTQNTFYIPSTIIQPFVENAILHGLRHKSEGQAMLKLHIQKLDDSIAISLLDNGVGREAAGKINKEKIQDKTSVGIAITQERIVKLNELYPGKTSLKVEDILEDGLSGTHVYITLPIITIENLNV